jgi:hypothetical protein
MRSAGEYGDTVATALEVPRQDLTYLPAATRNDNSKGSHRRKFSGDHQVEFSVIGLNCAVERMGAHRFKRSSRKSRNSCMQIYAR